MSLFAPKIENMDENKHLFTILYENKISASAHLLAIEHESFATKVECVCVIVCVCVCVRACECGACKKIKSALAHTCSPFNMSLFAPKVEQSLHLIALN